MALTVVSLNITFLLVKIKEKNTEKRKKYILLRVIVIGVCIAVPWKCEGFQHHATTRGRKYLATKKITVLTMSIHILLVSIIYCTKRLQIWKKNVKKKHCWPHFWGWLHTLSKVVRMMYLISLIVSVGSSLGRLAVLGATFALPFVLL